jgi:hypothetical protein
MLDLFQPPVVQPVPTRVICHMPDYATERQQQRIDALRKAWVARSKGGEVRYGDSHEEKLARRREYDRKVREQKRGSAEHEAAKAKKRNRYHSLTDAQKKAVLAQKREWYARKKRLETPQGRHYEANKERIKADLRLRYATDPVYRAAKVAATKARREASRA